MMMKPKIMQKIENCDYFCRNSPADFAANIKIRQMGEARLTRFGPPPKQAW
jgi:hypothetical protein